MKKWVFYLFMMGGMFIGAQASLIEYGGHYYGFVKTYGTWDEVNALANSSTIVTNDITFAGHLWTLSSQDEYTSIRANLGFAQWEIAFIGARNVDDTYTWVNDEGAVDFEGWIATIWNSPNYTHYGTSIGGSGYGYGLGTQDAGATYQYVIEYEAIPEPTGLALVAVGLVTVAGLRKIGINPIV